MTDIATLRAAAAEARATAARSQALGMPGDTARRDNLHAPAVRAPSTLQVERVKKDGQDFRLIEGYASVFERGYEMWDFFGPYTEIVSAGAADVTLKADPEVAYRFNHTGTPMARTTNGRLELWADDIGLGDRAWVNPTRGDVAELTTAIDDKDVNEQSFMFSIVSGQWSPDYTEYRINQFDLDRGDVGPVTYGANPYTSVAARSGQILAALPQLPVLAAREAYSILQHRPDLTAVPADRTGELVKVGRSVSLWQHILDDDA